MMNPGAESDSDEDFNCTPPPVVESAKNHLKLAARKIKRETVLVIGISGACRKRELVNLEIDDFVDLSLAAVIKRPDTKTKRQRTFTITGEFYIFTKCALLGPSAMAERGFFINHQNKKCTREVLEKPGLYTGHCYRRSSATTLVDAGSDITALKYHGEWRFSSVAERYIEEYLANKMKVADTILYSKNL
ncbi:hypothetical protein ILUMI_22544 [Ignelater luminosus]|uniref:Tyr recombinase domain-containing protein n=1 Tax=Ignelater luminosus TaxID=2038154 RepID=A0A8K0CGG9_IGNLU|nr:hypothetical protein ILUMI_22546 [Ignelater luminosus]KAF2883629.1 hypothetical protein ILUMI_22544 [Ignelater luminosus]